MKFEDRARELRNMRGLTLKDLSTATGLSISYLSDIERGRTIPTLSTLETLAKAFGISITDYLTGVDFAGEQTLDGLPAGLKDLVEDKDFEQEIDEHWINLLSKIELRGSRPQSKREWLELYLHLRRIFGEG
ncbi:MAG: helix-turn-helix transcriptional regulator [Anaerolineae bacterium]|nr:helix-turn-helix transcriptional regulator [Anaerolineae bacterium]